MWFIRMSVLATALNVVGIGGVVLSGEHDPSMVFLLISSMVSSAALIWLLRWKARLSFALQLGLVLLAGAAANAVAGVIVVLLGIGDREFAAGAMANVGTAVGLLVLILCRRQVAGWLRLIGENAYFRYALYVLPPLSLAAGWHMSRLPHGAGPALALWVGCALLTFFVYFRAAGWAVPLVFIALGFATHRWWYLTYGRLDSGPWMLLLVSQLTLCLSVLLLTFVPKLASGLGTGGGPTEAGVLRFLERFQ